MRALLQTSCNGMRKRADNRAPRSTDEQSKTLLRELAVLFLKLGTIGFGGPAAHIAMMEDEVVRRRRWMKHDEFLDLLGATNLIPGPEFDGDGNPHRPSTGRLERTGGCRY